MLSLLKFIEECHEGKCSNTEAQQQALVATQQYNPRFGALREWLEAPLTPTEGPLCGVTVSAKDNIGVEGMQTWAGSARALPDTWTRTGSFIQRLQSLGAVISSKSHCAEFALGGSGYNPKQGTPINPWSSDKGLVPGGSSSGTAVAVASGMAMLGVGTDTGGSVRVPAALCGCVGYRTSLEHWPMDGIVPLLPRADTLGLITRNLDDLLYAVAAIDALAPIKALPLPRVRIALWPEALLSDCDADRRRSLRLAAEALQSAGCEIVEADHAAIEFAYALLTNGPNSAAIEFAHFLNAELPAWRSTLNSQVADMVSENERFDLAALEARNQQFLQLANHRETFFAGTDFVLSPTTAIAPPPIASLANAEGYEKYSNSLLNFTVMGSLYRCCGISLPAGLDSNGLPMGLQLLARPDDDERLLAMALGLQQWLPPTLEPNLF